MRLTKPVANIAVCAVILLAAVVCTTQAAAQTFKVLHQFGAPGDGASPTGPLVFDSSGSLYGATYFGPGSSGCSHGCGTVYQAHPSSGGNWSESVIFAFNGSDGAYPGGRILMDAQANLYGTTACNEDYCYNQGFVYELSPGSGGSWTETVAHRFFEPWEGGEPHGLLFDHNGNLNGVTYYGGLNNTGTAFTLYRSLGWKERLAYVFGNAESSQDGNYPAQETALDVHGNLYGATNLGGADSAGIVFELKAGTGTVFWPEQVLYTFTGLADGYYPNGVIFGPDGNLYGTTEAGGANGDGEVFELASNGDGTWTQSVIYSFQGGSDGSGPTAGITFDAAGNIFGSTPLGGGMGCDPFGCGTIYKLTRGSTGWSETVLYRFNGVSDGAYPSGPVTLDAAGNIFDVAEAGGPYGNYGGILFEVTP